MDTTYVQGLMDQRQAAWHQAKAILDRCVQDKRERSAEEDAMFNRANADIDKLGKSIEEWVTNDRQQREADVARAAFEPLLRPEASAVTAGMSAIEKFFRHGGNSTTEVNLRDAVRVSNAIRGGADAAEVRALYSSGGASAGSLVTPVLFEHQLYQYVEASSAIRRIARVITTENGDLMTLPRVATHGVGTQVISQGTALAGTDPVFGTMALNAYKYGQLVRVSTEFVNDAGFDLLGFIAQNVGRAIGRVTDTAYVTGSGTSAPNGVTVAAGTGVKTGGSLIALTMENLIDLQHSIVDEYRQNGSFVMNDLTAGTLRKIRDGGGGTIGSFIWTPATTFAGVGPLALPDRLLGSNAYTDTNFATQGSALRAVAYGDFSTYYIRDSGGFRFERSDDRYFDTDEVGFRGVLRTDGNLIDTGAIKTTSQSV